MIPVMGKLIRIKPADTLRSLKTVEKDGEV
jgi:hypothetical protein